MTRVRRFLRLAGADRMLLVHAGILVLAIRMALWVLPWRLVTRLLGPPSSSRPRTGFSVERCAWAIRNASRLVPAATCLTQAVALRRLLARADRPFPIVIGVSKNAIDGFRAHAWVECGAETAMNDAGECHPFARLLVREPLTP